MVLYTVSLNEPYTVVVTRESGLNTSTVVTPPETTASVSVLKPTPVQSVVLVVTPGIYTSMVLVAPPEAGNIVVVEPTEPVQYEVRVVLL